MRHDGGKLSGLLAVLAVGQAAIIGYLFTAGSDDEMVIPRTVRIAEVESEAEREAAREELRESLGARRRASRLAAVERGLARARATVRELRGRLEESELAHAELERSLEREAQRHEAELAAARNTYPDGMPPHVLIQRMAQSWLQPEALEALAVNGMQELTVGEYTVDASTSPWNNISAVRVHGVEQAVLDGNLRVDWAGAVVHTSAVNFRPGSGNVDAVNPQVQYTPTGEAAPIQIEFRHLSCEDAQTAVQVPGR